MDTLEKEGNGQPQDPKDHGNEAPFLNTHATGSVQASKQAWFMLCW